MGQVSTAQPGSITDIAFYSGVIAERQRIIKYLLENNIIREQMLDLPGYVAVTTDGNEAIVLDFKPKPGDRSDS